jgi:predicted RNase H-like nuclease
MAETVIGVDGCPAGWIAAIWRDGKATIKLFPLGGFVEILNEDAAVIAVDMPIGLPQQHGRRAERAARRVLKARGSSVFSTASRAAYAAKTWEEACEINLKNSDPPKKLSKQSFALSAKIREIDAVISPELQTRIREVHPEVIFFEMNDCRPVLSKKKNAEGRAERIEILKRSNFPFSTLEWPNFLKKDVGGDDIIDACACAWSARRILEGKESHYPPEEERDARGLVMRIHA